MHIKDKFARVSQLLQAIQRGRNEVARQMEIIAQCESELNVLRKSLALPPIEQFKEWVRGEHCIYCEEVVSAMRKFGVDDQFVALFCGPSIMHRWYGSEVVQEIERAQKCSVITE